MIEHAYVEKSVAHPLAEHDVDRFGQLHLLDLGLDHNNAICCLVLHHDLAHQVGEIAGLNGIYWITVMS